MESGPAIMTSSSSRHAPRVAADSPPGLLSKAQKSGIQEDRAKSLLSLRFLERKLQNKERSECNSNAPDVVSEKQFVVHKEADTSVWVDQYDWSTPPDSRLAAEGMDAEEIVTLAEQSRTEDWRCFR